MKINKILIEDLNYFLNENKSENVNKKITYKIKYIHPILKKRFGGPSKLEVEDEINIFIFFFKWIYIN